MLRAHLQDEVGNEGAGFILGQVVVLSAQHGKEQLQVLQDLHQDCGVGVEEAQGEPLQDEVQAADGGLTLALQSLHRSKRKRYSTEQKEKPAWSKHSKCSHDLHHDPDGLDVSLEVKVEELVLQPLCKARRHLSLQLLHILVPRCDEVPLQYLQGATESSRSQGAL